MKAEFKIYISAAATFIAGILISHGVGDPAQSATISSSLNTIFGDLMDLGSAIYVLETLLVKHKAEIADNYYEPQQPEEPANPQTVKEVVNSTPAVQATETPAPNTPDTTPTL